MSLPPVPSPLPGLSAGEAMHQLMAEVFPLCRSITGEGTRQTLRHYAQLIPLTIHEVPSGTRVLDWTVPPEWNIRGATLQDPNGNTVVDFADHNLHVLNYSVPTHTQLSLADLRPHLYSLPDQPDLIPYRTSYYRPNWGFCLPHRQLAALPEGTYEAHVDATLAPGHLTYGECVIPGTTPDEVLLSCHVCHPSLANDNLSGNVVAVFLARLLAQRRLKYTYRFVFVPGTIGAITWLARNPEAAGRVRHGLVLTLLGGPGNFTYKRSRRGQAAIDRTLTYILRHSGIKHQVIDFFPYGYDERQYCSPGFDLPVGCLMRTPFGQYPEYHTSADNLSLVRPAQLEESLALLLATVETLESDVKYANALPHGEPQLGNRGLYGAINGEGDNRQNEMAMLWLLNFSDGDYALREIADRSGLEPALLDRVAQVLQREGLLRAL